MPTIAERLQSMLARGIATGAELQRELGVSQPTLSRAITELGTTVVRIKGGRSARYGLRRDLPQIGASWPVFQLGETGAPALLGRLNALARDRYWFVAEDRRLSAISDGLPYFIQDLWPQGFVGRTVPKRYSELGLPERITDWNDAHTLSYLTQRGDDCVGNLLLGDESLKRYLHFAQQRPTVTTLADRSNHYPLLADAAIAGAPPGSSAGGEQPKFTAALGNSARPRHVLVKFSPAGNDRTARRWADLLVSEHLAGKRLGMIGAPACATELIAAGGRLFLEAERFDRTGTRGRRGIVSLAAVVDHYIGRRDNWISAAAELRALGKITSHDAETTIRLATFGQLIGNTDMHFGNLSFYFNLGQRLSLAPSYDMLPMIHAPVTGHELVDRQFEVPMPDSRNLKVWRPMAEAAELYWREVADHELVSAEFKVCARRNAELLARAQ